LGHGFVSDSALEGGGFEPPVPLAETSRSFQRNGNCCRGEKGCLESVVYLSGFTVKPATESGDKLTRFGPFSAQCRAGNVKILRGPWNEDLFRVLEGFPDLAHDDEVDACSGALEMLNPNMKGWGAYELARRQAEQLRAEREATSGRAQPGWAPGSMEWLAEQKKSS
jgi:Terminase RNaseH-like domain